MFCFFFLNALDKPQGECCGINICSLGTRWSPFDRICGLRVSLCARGFYLCFLYADSPESGLERGLLQARTHSTVSSQGWGWGQLSFSCVWHGKKHTVGKGKHQLWVRTELSCSVCMGFFQHSIFTVSIKVTRHVTCRGISICFPSLWSLVPRYSVQYIESICFLVPGVSLAISHWVWEFPLRREILGQILLQSHLWVSASLTE